MEEVEVEAGEKDPSAVFDNNVNGEYFMEYYVLKVTTQELRSKATALQEQIEFFKKDWDKIHQIVNNEKQYWKGDASDKHQKLLESCNVNMLRVISHLEKHPKKLLQMAKTYEKDEKEAARLPGSVFTDFM